MQPGPTGPPPASGPPGGPPGEGGGQMAPPQAMKILQGLGIGPQQVDTVLQACMAVKAAMSQGAEQQAPPQGGGLMQALSSRYQEPAA
jgi:hypothetical protein